MIVTIIMCGLATTNLLCIFYTCIRHRKRMKILEEMLVDLKISRMRLADKMLGDIKRCYQYYKDKIVVYNDNPESVSFYDKDSYCVVRKTDIGYKLEIKDNSNQ